MCHGHLAIPSSASVCPCVSSCAPLLVRLGLTSTFGRNRDAFPPPSPPIFHPLLPHSPYTPYTIHRCYHYCHSSLPSPAVLALPLVLLLTPPLPLVSHHSHPPTVATEFHSRAQTIPSTRTTLSGQVAIIPHTIPTYTRQLLYTTTATAIPLQTTHATLKHTSTSTLHFPVPSASIPDSHIPITHLPDVIAIWISEITTQSPTQSRIRPAT